MNKYVIFVVMARRFFRAFDQWLCQIFLAHFADGSQVFYPSDVIFVTATATLDARHSRFWSPSIQTCISVRPKFKLIQKDSPSLIIQFTNDNWCISTSCWISCLYFKMINIPNMNEWIQWGEEGGGEEEAVVGRQSHWNCSGKSVAEGSVWRSWNQGNWAKIAGYQSTLKLHNTDLSCLAHENAACGPIEAVRSTPRPRLKFKKAFRRLC